MSKIRQPKVPFAIVPNIAIEDRSLKVSSRFLYTFLCNLPDNWEYSIKGLAVAAGCGVKTIRSAVKELEEHGYLHRIQLRKDNKFAGFDYLIVENPKNKNVPKSSSLRNGDDGDWVMSRNSDDTQNDHNKTSNSIKQETIINNNSKPKEAHITDRSVTYRNRQVETLDAADTLLQRLCPEGYKLCTEIGIEISVAESMYSIMSHELFMDYLNFTYHAVKNSTIYNPTGFFIDAIKNQYNIQSRLNPVGVAREVIEKTENEMREQLERELSESTPVSPDSPLYKYYLRHVLGDSPKTT